MLLKYHYFAFRPLIKQSPPGTEELMLLKNTKLYITSTEMAFFIFTLECSAGHFKTTLEKGETFNIVIINGV